jgi:competence ComEA-like helix-hairpin-helix protein
MFTKNILALVLSCLVSTLAYAESIPGVHPKPPTVVTAPAGPEAATINLNTANAKELSKLKGLNPAKVKNIVSYHKKHGDFTSLDELSHVKGFKKLNAKKMQLIQEQLHV